MKKKIIFFVIVLGIIAFISYKIYADAKGIIKHPFIVQDKNIEVTVKKGDTLTGVINDLYEQKKIGNSYLIKWYIKDKKLDTNIKPGTYSFPDDINLETFIKGLGEGKYNENAVKITIPEGYGVEQIAQLLQDKEIIDKDNFIKAVKEYNIPSYVKKDVNRRYSLEGFLFPDTYELIKGMKGKDIIDIMIKKFDSVIGNIEAETGKKVADSELDKIVVLASLVERETEAVDERVKVSSVLYNRLSQNMPLQIDSTVEYALRVHKTIYTYEDLKVQSPYNTYSVPGLPAGPICSPGKASLKAAIEPASTKYIYYVAKFDGSKQHFFSDNYNTFLNDKKVSQNNYAKMKK